MPAARSPSTSSAQRPPGVRVRGAPGRGRASRRTRSPRDHPAIRAATAALEDVYPGEEVLLAVHRRHPAGDRAVRGRARRQDALLLLLHGRRAAHAPNEFLRIRRLARGHARLGRSCVRLLAGPHRLAPPTEAASHDRGLPLLRLPARTASCRRSTLAPEFGRVPPYDAGLDAGARRAGRAAAARQSIVDQPARPPGACSRADMRRHPARTTAPAASTPRSTGCAPRA